MAKETEITIEKTVRKEEKVKIGGREENSEKSCFILSVGRVQHRYGAEGKSSRSFSAQKQTNIDSYQPAIAGFYHWCRNN